MVIRRFMFFRQIYDTDSGTLQEHKKDLSDFSFSYVSQIYFACHQIYFMLYQIFFVFLLGPVTENNLIFERFMG